MRVLVVCFLLLLPGLAYCGPLEEEAFDSFQRYCLQGMAAPDQLAKLVQEEHGEPFSQAAANQYLHQAGHIWTMKNKSLKYYLLVTDRGTCTTRFSPLDFKAEKQIFETRTFNRLASFNGKRSFPCAFSR